MQTLNRSAWKQFHLAALAAGALFSSLAAAQTPPSFPTPIVRENITVKISQHVYLIPDGNVPAVPNVGIIVGSRATLVVDTGLGIPNGETILREVAKVSKNSELYVATTHYHPEHTTGGGAFPAPCECSTSTCE